MTIWLTQWGSKSLGDQGYSPIEILRYYYGDDMYINTAEAISGIPSSWPGYTLEIGSSGNKVLQMQEQLNVIASAYPAIPKITADKIAELERRNLDLQMENDLLKKVRELERRGRYL